MESEREQAEAKLMAALNDIGRHHGGIFDFGDLGLCLIRNTRHGWACEWYKREAMINLLVEKDGQESQRAARP